MVGAGAKAFFVHLGNHGQGPFAAFFPALGEDRELRNFRRNKKACRGIWACGDTGATANAGRRVHGLVGAFFADEHAVCFGRRTSIDGNVTTLLDDAVETQRGSVWRLI